MTSTNTDVTAPTLAELLGPLGEGAQAVLFHGTLYVNDPRTVNTRRGTASVRDVVVRASDQYRQPIQVKIVYWDERITKAEEYLPCHSKFGRASVTGAKYSRSFTDRQQRTIHEFEVQSLVFSPNADPHDYQETPDVVEDGDPTGGAASDYPSDL